ncbi:MAG: 3-deoxy-8-phosphooctulonate synthase [Planctomycetota bacterium]|nr:3-deoxy-8-phosphooctulonate synthase [Planctomycetota bacterium]
MVRVGRLSLRRGGPLFLIAGPCVIEDRAHTLRLAGALTAITKRLRIPFVFKASYDKANRLSADSYRGPGLDEGLDVLSAVKERYRVPVLSDVHCRSEVARAAEVLDVIQIPAFLCRQTDLLTAAASTGKPINIKKGQFIAPWDMKHIVAKAEKAGAREIILTERGVSFGYNNLVSDMRAIPVMQQSGYPVVFDATHSVQLPGGLGSASGGQREMIPVLARAAVAAGCDGIFVEVHDNPDKALCDGPNSLHIGQIAGLLRRLKAISEAVRH